MKRSLTPVPQELNEIDWKGHLSDKSERLAEHISAYCNLRGGGVLAFGVNDDASFEDLSREEIEEIVKRMGNIALHNLAWSVQLEHAVLDFEGHAVLFVRIAEQPSKPIYLRGKTIYDSYIRSAGHTVRMSEQQVHDMLALQRGNSFEKRVARGGVSADEVMVLMDCKKLFELTGKPMPKDSTFVVSAMAEYGLCKAGDKEKWDITNLGALLFARQLSDFDSLKGREMIVRKYSGTNNRLMSMEQKMSEGYAVGFEDLVNFIYKNTCVESIEVMREAVPTYPKVAIREIVANALVHQDFLVRGMPLTVEIFSNRMVITNPGSSLNDVNRLIDLPPHSRNEDLAQMMLELHICERRGSGVDRAVDAIESMCLPAYKAQSGDDYTRVTLFPRKDVAEMSADERISACYQHACLKYEDGVSVNNQMIRDRFGLDKNRSALASRILSDTLDSGLIKLENPDTGSRRYATYIPYYG